MIKKIIIGCLCAFQVSASIVETNEIGSIEKSVTRDSLVFFGISDTLYQSGSLLTSGQWQSYFEQRVYYNDSDKRSAEKFINSIKNRISKISKKPVDKDTEEIISNLQDQKIPVLGITDKSYKTPYAENNGYIISSHLQSLGIDLGNSVPLLTFKSDQVGSTYNFSYGIIFSNNQPVAPAIFWFINTLQFKPKKVIMVDNSRGNLETTEAALKRMDIAFDGFLYASTTVEQSFDPILATIEFLAFVKDGRILSDEQAQKIRAKDPKRNYTRELDQYILDQTYESF